MKTFLIALLLVSSTACAQDLVVTNVAVYSSPEASRIEHATVVIRHGLIAEVGQHVKTPKDVETISCPGCVVMAGFWNAHVHFMEPKWNDAAHQPAGKLQSALSDMLTHSGFTTVVDTGSDVENTAALRRRIQDGEIAGPRILTAGIPIFPAGALPYYLAELPPELKSKMAQPKTPAEAVACVDRNRAAGADLVKLFTGSIVRPGQIAPMQVEIARAAVDEAHRRGLLVFSHSSNLEGTQVAIKAGVDVLAHTPEDTRGINEDMLHRMIAQRMTIIPTLKLFSRDETIEQIRQLIHRYYQLGGRVVYGTDTGFLADYDQGEEFRELAKAGFSFREIMAMLTTAPAELFHMSGRQGKVQPGMHGDLTILSEDPASGNAEAFTAVKYTIRDGKIIWARK